MMSNKIDLDKYEYEWWHEFREKNSDRLSREEVKKISLIHARLFNHKLYTPCSCSPRTIQGWINDINNVYKNQKHT